MSSHWVTILGYLLVLAAGAGLEIFAARTRRRVPPLGDVLSRVMRTRTGRVGILIAWGWIGLHFFAK
jgi:hypothetical protein